MCDHCQIYQNTSHKVHERILENIFGSVCCACKTIDLHLWLLSGVLHGLAMYKLVSVTRLIYFTTQEC